MRGLAERGARVGWTGTPAGPLRFAVRGAGPPALLVHGLGDSLAGWAQVAGALSRRHELHLLDLPGHGLSRDPPDWRLSTLAAGVAHYARGMRQAPLLVGHSLGGWIALRLAASGTVPLSGLMLVNPAGAPAEWAPFRELISAKDRRGVERYLKAAWHRPPLALRLLPQEVITAMWARAARGVLDAVVAGDFLTEDELRDVRVPVRILWGEGDRLLPEGTLAFLRRALPQAEVVLLPKCAHVPHLESPRLLARELLKPLPVAG